MGQRFQNKGWHSLFVDVERAADSADVVALLAEEMHGIQSMTSRLRESMRQLMENVEEVSASQFRLKVRAGLTAGNWARHGEDLLRECANHEQPAMIVLDELPIFLMRMLRDDKRNAGRVDEFLSWLRGAFQSMRGGETVLLVSGSIGLAPVVSRLGMSDRINYLHPIRVSPWSRETSIACVEELARSYNLALDGGVAAAMYERLGLGIPHHVQSFFVHMRDDAMMLGQDRLTLSAVDRVYRTSLLGPWGQNDLMHYVTRLQDHLDEAEYRVAMEVLTEAATQGHFTARSRRCLEDGHRVLDTEIQTRVTAVLEVLEHDGYLLLSPDGHHFASLLLKDWWCARFERGFVPLEHRPIG